MYITYLYSSGFELNRVLDNLHGSSLSVKWKTFQWRWKVYWHKFSEKKKAKEYRPELKDFTDPETLKGRLNERHLFYMTMH